MSSIIETKFGDAYLQPTGYYRINGGEYKNKYLHRLVFEDFYQINIDDEFDEPMVIHHIDEDKSNNEIWNLDIMPASEHSKYHADNQRHSDESKLARSKAKNTTGYFRVSIIKAPTYKQGFRYVYSYYEDGKQNTLSAVDLDKLEEKVIAKGLLWEKFEDVPDEPKEEINKNKNKTGYLRVSKMKDICCKNGFRYRYKYYENGKQKQLTCVDLDGLKDKVIKKGLKWKVID